MPDGADVRGLLTAGGLAVRTPLLPAATAARLTGGAARAAWRAGQPLDDAVAADLAHLAREVAALVADPLVRTAIAYASPDLGAALDRRPPGSPPRGLLGYLLRMAGRPVPFGLFATCSAGTVHGRPRYDLGAGLRVAARLDVAAAGALAREVPAGTLTYLPNGTAHVAAGRLRLVERDAAGRYHPLAVEADEALLAVLGAARGGATLAALAESLTDDEVTFAEAYEYVAELADAQVLVPDLPLSAVAAPAEVAAFAADPAPETLGRAVAAVRVAAPDVAPDRTLHVDATRPAAFVLGDAVLTEARRAVDLLHRLQRERPGEADLTAFKAAFAARYGAAEVPLLVALDPETGVGYGTATATAAAGAPLLTGFAAATAHDAARWTPVDHHLVDLLSRALRVGAREIEVPAHELHSLRNQAPRPLPDSFALRCTVAARDAEAVAAGDFRLVVHDATGIGVVARFAALDPALDALVREQVAREEALRPDAVHAEVVHVPSRRAANLAPGRAPRTYEIPVLTATDVPPDRRIPPSDLLVSVVGDRVVLRSRRFGREVLPRVTSAHDPRGTALPVYRFLAAVEHDGVAALGWSWGAVGSAPYLPRVVVGRLVLARAAWRWFTVELRELAAAATPAARYAAVQRLREAWDVPRWVALAHGDRELPVDLDGVAAAELLAAAARRAGQLTLREQLPAPDELCLTGPGGGYGHEVVLPFVRESVEPRPAVAPAVPATAHVPGGEWLAVRVETGVAAADGLLREVVRPLVAGVPAWSYDRGERHLRLALRGDPAALLARLRDLLGPLVADGTVADVRLETYRPDGGELLAHADSEAALRVVELGDDLDLRWRAALHGVDRLLAGLDPDQRRATVRAMRDRLVAALGDNGPRALRHAGRVHRARRAELAAPDPRVAAILDARAAAIPGVPEPGVACERHVRRLLRAAHGVQQVVIYDLLDRRYVTRDAGRS